MSKKYMSFETSFISLKNNLKFLLDFMDVRYEISGNGGFYHFEIFMDEIEKIQVESWLDANTIQEV
jgi:hypothetical protein